MPLYRRPGSDFWWMSLRHSGSRIRRSSGTTDRREAQRMHDELAARLWQHKRTGHTLDAAFLAWAKAAPRTRQELTGLGQIRAGYADRPLFECTDATFADAFGDLKPATYNRLANIFRAALRIAEAKGWLDRAPKITRRKEPVRDCRFLTGAEWDRLRPALPEHLRPMAEFAIATGLRWSNVAGLTWERVSVAKRLAWIPATQAKAGRAIAVPLSDAAIAALRAAEAYRDALKPARRKRADACGLVFTYTGRPIGSAKTGFHSACTAAEVVGFRWHDFRHTWASWHVMNGTPLAVLQKLGGWESPEMVQRYAHFAPEHLAAYAGNALAPKVETPKRKARTAQRERAAA